MPEARGHGHVALGFDFGLKRIGVATADTISATAAPRTMVRVSAFGPDWAEIERLLRDYRPSVLVVGSPRHADGSQSALGPASDRFAAELAQRSGLPVERADEFASSLEASVALRGSRQRGVRRRRVRHGDLDAAAAAIILQRWLAGRRPADRPTNTTDSST